MSYKTFQDGQILPAADVQLLMDQTIIEVPNAAGMDAIPVPQDGMVIYRRDLGFHLRRLGGTWRLLTDYASVANAAVRDSLPAHNGLLVSRRDSGSVDRYDGSAWQPWTTPWKAFVPGGGWTTFGQGLRGPGLRRVDGTLELRGSIKGGGVGAGNAFLQLSAADFPVDGQDVFLVPANGGFADLRIDVTGKVWINAYSGGGNNGIVTLTGLRFTPGTTQP